MIDLAQHPYLAALASGLVGWHIPVPSWRTWLGALHLKGILMSTSTNPIIAALQNDVPALIVGTKAITKALLDTVYTTGTPDEKAAALTAQLEPKFNAQLATFGLPAWALGMVDGVFAQIVRVTVEAVEV